MGNIILSFIEFAEIIQINIACFLKNKFYLLNSTSV